MKKISKEKLSMVKTLLTSLNNKENSKEKLSISEELY